MLTYANTDKNNNSKFIEIIIVVIIMSEFAFFRFRSTSMLTIEEEQHKDEIIELTEEVLEAKGIECDSKISKISEKQLREILEEENYEEKEKDPKQQIIQLAARQQKRKKKEKSNMKKYHILDRGRILDRGMRELYNW